MHSDLLQMLAETPSEPHEVGVAQGLQQFYSQFCEPEACDQMCDGAPHVPPMITNYIKVKLALL